MQHLCLRNNLMICPSSEANPMGVWVSCVSSIGVHSHYNYFYYNYIYLHVLAIWKSSCQYVIINYLSPYLVRDVNRTYMPIIFAERYLSYYVNSLICLVSEKKSLCISWVQDIASQRIMSLIQNCIPYFLNIMFYVP